MGFIEFTNIDLKETSRWDDSLIAYNIISTKTIQLYIYKRFLNQTRDIFATRIFELWILGFSGACEDAGMPPEVNFLFRKFLLQQHTDPGSERLVMVGRVHGVVVKCGPVFLFFAPAY